MYTSKNLKGYSDPERELFNRELHHKIKCALQENKKLHFPLSDDEVIDLVMAIHKREIKNGETEAAHYLEEIKELVRSSSAANELKNEIYVDYVQ